MILFMLSHDQKKGQYPNCNTKLDTKLDLNTLALQKNGKLCCSFSEWLLVSRIPVFSSGAWSNVQPLQRWGKGMKWVWDTLVHSTSRQWSGEHTPMMIDLDEVVWLQNVQSCQSLSIFRRHSITEKYRSLYFRSVSILKEIKKEEISFTINIYLHLKLYVLFIFLIKK